MNVNVDIKIDYTIKPIYERKSFDRIVYEFKWLDITLAKGILTKFDITTSLPYLASINADYYTIVMEHIISSIITNLQEKLGIKIDRNELLDENITLFECFIPELKTNVNDIQTKLNK